MGLSAAPPRSRGTWRRRAARRAVRNPRRSALTGFQRRQYDRCRRGFPISEHDRESFDFERLERAVEALSEAHRRLREENVALRRKVEERSRRVRALEERLIEANQQRQDVAKRVDELIAQLDHLDGQLGRSEE